MQAVELLDVRINFFDCDEALVVLVEDSEHGLVLLPVYCEVLFLQVEGLLRQQSDYGLLVFFLLFDYGFLLLYGLKNH